MTASRNAIRSGTRSQWSSRNSGVMWSYLRPEKTTRAAALKQTEVCLSADLEGQPVSHYRNRVSKERAIQ